MEKKAKIAVYSAVALLIAGLGGHFARQIYLIKQIEYNLLGFVIKSINKDKIVIALTLQINNKSDITAIIKNYDINVAINGINTGKIKYNKSQVIKPSSTTNLILQFDIPLKQYFNLQDIVKMITNYFSDKSKISIALTGKVDVNHSFFNLELPINESFKLSDFDK